MTTAGVIVTVTSSGTLYGVEPDLTTLGKIIGGGMPLSAVAEVKETEGPAEIRRSDGSRTALVTARNSPAHERVIRTLRAWNVRVDETFFLGGVAKDKPQYCTESRNAPFDKGELAEQMVRDCLGAIETFNDPEPLWMVRIGLAPCSPFSVTSDLMRESVELARDGRQVLEGAKWGGNQSKALSQVEIAHIFLNQGDPFLDIGRLVLKGQTADIQHIG